MSRLIASGCSYTYGHGLSDCDYGGLNTEDDSAIHTASLFAWPQLAATRLGVECVNLAQPGQGNKYICHSILSYQIEPGDIVVPAWSFFSRNCIIPDQGTILPLGNWMIPDPDTDTGYGALDPEVVMSQAYYEHLYTENNCTFENLAYINLLDNYVKNQGATIIHVSIEVKTTPDIDLFPYRDLSSCPWNSVEVQMTFPGDSDFGLCADGSHPDAQAHAIFAEKLCEYIENLR